MNKPNVSNRAAMIVALLAGLALPGAAIAQDYGNCLSRQEIQRAVQSGLIVELADAMAAAGVDGRPKGVPEVCMIDGSLQSVVSLGDSYGNYNRKALKAELGSQ